MHFSTFIGVACFSCLGLLFPFVRSGLIAMFRFFSAIRFWLVSLVSVDGVAVLTVLVLRRVSRFRFSFCFGCWIIGSLVVAVVLICLRLLFHARSHLGRLAD